MTSKLIEIGWNDFLNEEMKFEDTGKALLYRNPAMAPMDDPRPEISIFKYARSRADCKDLPPEIPAREYFGDQPTIAEGFTAFAAEFKGSTRHSLRYLLAKNILFDRDIIYNDYFDIVYNPVRNKNIRASRRIPELDLEIQFCRDHLVAEASKLQASESYYNECLNDADQKVKADIKDYAVRYMIWIQDKLKEKIKEKEKLHKEGFHSELEDTHLPTVFSSKQLEIIFSRLQSKKIVNNTDEVAFLGIFRGERAGRVYWNEKISGAKPTLFSLMIRLTGIELMASDLKKYFITDKPIHDKWNGHTKSKITKVILEGI